MGGYEDLQGGAAERLEVAGQISYFLLLNQEIPPTEVGVRDRQLGQLEVKAQTKFLENQQKLQDIDQAKT